MKNKSNYEEIFSRVISYLLDDNTRLKLEMNKLPTVDAYNDVSHNLDVAIAEKEELVKKNKEYINMLEEVYVTLTSLEKQHSDENYARRRSKVRHMRRKNR